ncbi:MAG: efflux RND transporter periplasmic adaptor subunit [Pseudomonadales bacterium]
MTLAKEKWFPLIVLVLGTLLVVALLYGKPKPEPRPAPDAMPPLVDVIALMPAARVIPLHTQGTVQPRREIDLVTQVAGQVQVVATDFAAGGFFAGDETLVQIDRADYEIELISAKAKVADARQILAMEEGRARQAKREWRELGDKEANALFLRRPQVASAQAKLLAAEGDERRAQLNLSRTKISAPYAGRIRETYVDVGQYVTPGTKIARVYATDKVEVRLPLTDRQLGLLHLPINYSDTHESTEQVSVILHGVFGGTAWQWPAQIVRTDASIDVQTRLMYAVAEVENPFARDETSSRPPLNIGQFVQAEIDSVLLPNVALVPRIALQVNNQVWLVDNKDIMSLMSVKVLQVDGTTAAIQADFPGESRLVVSPVTVAVDGIKVKTRQNALAEADL